MVDQKNIWSSLRKHWFFLINLVPLLSAEAAFVGILVRSTEDQLVSTAAAKVIIHRFLGAIIVGMILLLCAAQVGYSSARKMAATGVSMRIEGTENRRKSRALYCGFCCAMAHVLTVAIVLGVLCKQASFAPWMYALAGAGIVDGSLMLLFAADAEYQLLEMTKDLGKNKNEEREEDDDGRRERN